MRTPVRGVAAAGASAAGFGVLPVLAVWGADAGLNVMTLLILRFAGTAALLPLLFAGRPRRPRPPARSMCGLGILGLLFALQAVLYLVAIARIPPGLAVLLHYFHPAVVLALSAAIGQERLTGRLVLPMAVAMAGLALTVGAPGRADTLGVLCALGCAVVYAVYVVLGTRLAAGVDSTSLTMYVVSISALALVAVAVPTHRLDLDFAPRGWAVIAAIAVISTALPIALFFVSSTELGATRASILGMLEPIVGILAAWTALGANLTPLQLLGGTILLTGALLSAHLPPTPTDSPHKAPHKPQPPPRSSQPADS